MSSANGSPWQLPNRRWRPPQARRPRTAWAVPGLLALLGVRHRGRAGVVAVAVLAFVAVVVLAFVAVVVLLGWPW